MIDLHCHILPGIDDGSASLEESCLMARMAADSGVTAIAATPHCNIPGRVDNYLSPRLRDSFLAMARLIKEQNLPIRLHTGAEVLPRRICPGLSGRRSF